MLYTFSRHDPRNGIYPVQGNLIDISGKLVYYERIDTSGRELLNNQISTYTVTPFTLADVTDADIDYYKTRSWNTENTEAFKTTLRDANINIPNTGLQRSLFIVLNQDDTFKGYMYKYNAIITSRIWGIEDYCRSVFAIYEPVTDSAFNYTLLTGDNKISGSMITILIHDTVTSENRIYTYNYSKYEVTYIELNIDDNILTIEGHKDGGLEQPVTSEIHINTTDVITVLTYNGKGYSLENLQARRLRYSEDTWVIGPCLIHLPSLNKLGYLFSNTITPWFDLKLGTITMDIVIHTYTITKTISMLSLYKYVQPIMIYNDTIINTDNSKLVNITDDNGNYSNIGLQTNSWQGFTVINTQYFIELNLREHYYIEYDYYDAFNLTLEFS
jgi:hypothetical protein